MREALLRASLLAGIAAVSVPNVMQAQAPPEEARVARLVRDLGSPSHELRRAADAELANLGAASRSQLEAATQSADFEVRLRANDLLRRLKTTDLWQARQVKVPSGKVGASELLKELVQQTGNRFVVGKPGMGFSDKQVQLSAAHSEFWPAVDEINRQSLNYLRPEYDARQPRFAIVAGPPGKYPVAYAGPLRAQLNSAIREYSETFGYEGLDSQEMHKFEMDLQMIWEDRFRLIAYRAEPELLEAVTDTGEQVSSRTVPATAWQVAAASTRLLSAKLRVSPPSVEAKRLTTLKLRWGLIAVGDLATLNVEDLQARGPFRQDDLELVIERCAAVDGGRHEITLLIARDLPLPEPREILYEENQIEVLDAAGKPLRQVSQSNLLVEAGALIKLTVAEDGSKSPPRSLRLTYPRIRSQQEVDIVFHDVPLPQGRPK